jgi:hypothetical protein
LEVGVWTRRNTHRPLRSAQPGRWCACGRARRHRPTDRRARRHRPTDRRARRDDTALSVVLCTKDNGLPPPRFVAAHPGMPHIVGRAQAPGTHALSSAAWAMGAKAVRHPYKLAPGAVAHQRFSSRSHECTHEMRRAHRAAVPLGAAPVQAGRLSDTQGHRAEICVLLLHAPSSMARLLRDRS